MVKSIFMSHWRRATYAVVVIWIAAMARLFIADVWDESTALAVFGDAHQTAVQLVSTILKTPLPFVSDSAPFWISVKPL